MDRYKHNSSAQRSQRVKCAPSPIRPENSDDSTAKPTANGTGTLVFSSLWFNSVSHSCFLKHFFVFCFQMQNIATTTTNLSPTGHVRLYSFTLLVLVHRSASRTTTGEIISTQTLKMKGETYGQIVNVALRGFLKKKIFCPGHTSINFTVWAF